MKNIYPRFLGLIFFVIGLITPADFVFGQEYDLVASQGEFVPLVGGTELNEIEVDEAVSGQITLPFSFRYFGVLQTRIWVSSNGYIRFVDAPIVLSPNLSQSGAESLVAVFLSNLSGAGGEASFEFAGAPGEQIVTIQWLNWRLGQDHPNAGISLQVKLYEENNRIEFIYRQETFLEPPFATIGLSSHIVTQFYNLNDFSQNSYFAPAPVRLASLPETGQVYSFIPKPVTVSAFPAAATTNISASANGTSQLNISWQNGSGVNRLVLMKQTSAIEALPVLSNNVWFHSNKMFGSSQIGTSGWHVVYNGSGSSVNVENVNVNLSYRIKVVEYNGILGNQNYHQAVGGNNPRFFNPEPTAPLSTVATLNVTSTKALLNVTPRPGSSQAVFIKEEGTGLAPAVDDQTYVTNMSFLAAGEIGTSGWKSVFNGMPLAILEVTDLLPNKTYKVHVVDYNGTTGAENYNASAESATTTFTTFPAPIANVDYTFGAFDNNFVPLENATEIPEVQSDNGLSGKLPIGFTFYFRSVPFTEFIASSNGFISFNRYLAGVGSEPTNDLANTAARPLLAPLWDDLSFTEASVSYATSGTAPERVCTIQYLNAKWNQTAVAPSVSFQVKLFEVDNRIEFSYAHVSLTDISNPSASIGIAAFASDEYISLSDGIEEPTPLVDTEIVDIKTVPERLYVFVPDKINQTIDFSSFSEQIMADPAPTIELDAEATSELPVTYLSSDPTVASLDGNILTIHKDGTTDITAKQSGTSLYASAPDVVNTLVVVKAGQEITFAELPSKKYGAAPFAIEASTTSGLTVTFLSSDPTVATISGNTVTILKPGQTNITAQQEGNTVYKVADDIVRQLSIAKGDQTISFPEIANKKYGDPVVQLNQSATSGLPVSYESSNTAVATTNGNQLTIIGVGSTTITATQNGNENYNAAPQVLKNLVVQKGDQQIDFAALPEKIMGDPAFSLVASSNKGLPIQLSSSNTSVITIDGSMATIVGYGKSLIKATQAGNSNFNPAEVIREQVVRGTQQINFANIESKNVGGPNFFINATASSGLGVQLSTQSQNIILGNNIVQILSPGPATIVATQPGDEVFLAAQTVERTFCIIPPKPVIDVSGLGTDAPLLSSTAPLDNVWYKDGVEVAGQTGNTLSPVGGGMYTVKVVINGCSSEMSDPQSLIVTGLNDEQEAIRIFPNPATSRITVDASALDLKAPAAIEVIDFSGKQISRSMIQKSTDLDVSKLPGGTYLIRINSGKKSVVKEFVKR